MVFVFAIVFLSGITWGTQAAFEHNKATDGAKSAPVAQSEQGKFQWVGPVNK